MAINLDTLLVNLVIHIIVNIIFLSQVLWISGRLLAGKEKEVYGRTLDSDSRNRHRPGFRLLLLADNPSIIVLIIWLALVKHFSDCRWLKALAISIAAVLIFIAIAVVLTLIGIVIESVWF
jgi:hypothetical protein